MTYSISIEIGQYVLLFSIFLAVFRLLKGPTVFDRIVAFDCCLFLMLGLILLESIALASSDYMDILLVVSLLGFVGTLAAAAYLEDSILD